MSPKVGLGESCLLVLREGGSEGPFGEKPNKPVLSHEAGFEGVRCELGAMSQESMERPGHSALGTARALHWTNPN